MGTYPMLGYYDITFTPLFTFTFTCFSIFIQFFLFFFTLNIKITFESINNFAKQKVASG